MMEAENCGRRAEWTRATTRAARKPVVAVLLCALAAGHTAWANSYPEYQTEWGGIGQGIGQLLIPRSIAIHPSTGTLYVVESGNNRVQLFSPTGTPLDTWGMRGVGMGNFRDPAGIAISGTGKVYVADTGNSRVQRFSATGGFELAWGTKGTGDGQFEDPVGVAVLDDRIFVLDKNAVQEFGSDSTFVARWGATGNGPGQFSLPLDLVIGNNNQIYIVDTGNDRVSRYTLSGGYIDSFGQSGPGEGEFAEPEGIGVDAEGRILVADGNNTRVQVFSPEGVFVYAFGSGGTQIGEFSHPEDLVIDGDGNFYVIDGSHRLLKWSALVPVETTSWGLVKKAFLTPSD